MFILTEKEQFITVNISHFLWYDGRLSSENLDIFQLYEINRKYLINSTWLIID